MTTLQVLLHVAAQRNYELHSLDFSTAFLQGSLHEAIWTTVAALGFTPSTVDPLLILRTDTSLPPFYVLAYVEDLVFATADTEALALITRDRARRTTTLTQSHMVQQVLLRFDFTWSLPQPTPLSTGHSLSAPPSDESVEPSGPYTELVGCLITSGMGLVLGGPGLVVLTSHSDVYWADDQTTHRSTQRYNFSLGAGAPLADLPAPPNLYVNKKAVIALCQDQRPEHITKHIALRYFLTQELQTHGQLRLAYVATRANTADVFTEALGSSDHQRFCTSLGLVPTLPHLLDS
ncbi:unnamed protein product [Closterium sp. NIES-53]